MASRGLLEYDPTEGTLRRFKGVYPGFETSTFGMTYAPYVYDLRLDDTGALWAAGANLRKGGEYTFIESAFTFDGSSARTFDIPSTTGQQFQFCFYVADTIWAIFGNSGTQNVYKLVDGSWVQQDFSARWSGAPLSVSDRHIGYDVDGTGYPIFLGDKQFFSEYPTSTEYQFAQFDGTTITKFQSLDDMPSAKEPRSLQYYNGSWYASFTGSAYTDVNGDPVRAVARWDGSNWIMTTGGKATGIDAEA